jgi:hypothetical protein
MRTLLHVKLIVSASALSKFIGIHDGIVPNASIYADG